MIGGFTDIFGREVGADGLGGAELEPVGEAGSLAQSDFSSGYWRDLVRSPGWDFGTGSPEGQSASNVFASLADATGGIFGAAAPMLQAGLFGGGGDQGGGGGDQGGGGDGGGRSSRGFPLGLVAVLGGGALLAWTAFR
jgi:hypothetical protein